MIKKKNVTPYPGSLSIESSSVLMSLQSSLKFSIMKTSVDAYSINN